MAQAEKTGIENLTKEVIMSFIQIFRQKAAESSKIDASLSSLRYIHEVNPRGDTIKGAELGFKLESGQEYTIIFAMGQRNLRSKVERFLHPAAGKFGKERYKQPDWATYDGSQKVIPDENGLTLDELVVSALIFDSQQNEVDPQNLTVHRMFMNPEGESLWAKKYSCFIYVDESGNELSPAFGHHLQELKERQKASREVKQSMRAKLKARTQAS